MEKVVDNVEKPVDKKFFVDTVERCNYLSTTYAQARRSEKEKCNYTFTHY